MTHDELRNTLAKKIAHMNQYFHENDGVVLSEADEILSLIAKELEDAVRNAERYDTGGYLNENEVIKAIRQRLMGDE